MKKKNIPPLPKKEEKKNNRKIAEIVLATLIIIWTVCSVLGVIAFARTCENDMQVVSANADESVSTYELTESIPVADRLIEIPISYNGFAEYDTDTFSYSVYMQFGSLIYSPHWRNFIGYTTPFSSEIQYFTNTDGVSYAYNIGRVIAPNSSFDTVGAIDIYFSTDYLTRFPVNADVEFIYTTVPGVNQGRISYDIHVLYSNGYRYIFQVKAQPRTGDLVTYGRNYNDFIFGLLNYNQQYFESVGFDDGYDIGVSSSFDTGYSAGFDVGYADGYTDGDNVGFERGFNQGVAESNEYSFNGLITSVIDVPIKAFTGLFNFEILGVNLSGFFFALLTVCVVITVAKLFI